MRLFGQSNVTVQHVTFQGNTGSGAAINSSGSNAVKVYNSLLLDGCVASGAGASIRCR